MKESWIAVVLLLITSLIAFGQSSETVLIEKKNLQLENLRTGNSIYIVYSRKTPTSAAERITLVQISVEPTLENGRKVFAVTQRWESGDDIVHTARTLHDANDFTTVFHETWWKRLGYSTTFNFNTKQVEFNGPVDNPTRSQIVEDFNQSFQSYNLCWHSDLIIFSLLPYKDNRTMIINFYDPGFGKARQATYVVTGTEVLIASNGNKIDCWKMEHKFEVPSGGSGIQRFWISKRTHEVLKEEDQTPNGYRYKMKIGISG